MLKNLSFIIKINQDFIRHTDDEIKKNAPLLNKLFEVISNTYLPVLNMLEGFEKDAVQARIGLVITPVLCNLLSDSVIQDLYVQWIEKRIEFGQKELIRNKDNEKITENIKHIVQKFENNKKDFVEKYNQNLVTAFSEYQHLGFVELLATCGTDIFIPHYADMKEIISAQIESGLHSYKQFFGEIPEGFWLPELGYSNGVEKLIKAYGYTYTVLDARSILLAEKAPEKGLFYPARTENSLVLFGRDVTAYDEIFGEEGIITSPSYKNENKDVGFELSREELSLIWEDKSARISTGYKYWNKYYNDEEKSIYDMETAKKQAEADAEYFLTKKSEKLNKAEQLLPENDFVCLVCVFDAYDFSQNWSEGIYWLETVIRNAKNYGINITSCDKMLENQYSLEKIVPYYSAGIGTGYGENLLSSKNCWMMRYIRKACERMVDLSDRFPNDTGLKTRLLNLGAKELMMAQSLNLAKMIDSDENPEFAELRFKESIDIFTAVFDSLGSNTVSTEWLTTLEAKDSLFPWMNYRIFSKKR
ncbi:MAG: DUF1957 domain-containing protein [Spirochaetia bacterium]|nr:DUF1957 domain-containing protein [Spirochaetia bacterium]